MHKTPTICLMAGFLLLSPILLATEQSDDAIEAISKASDDVTLSFVRAGIIGEVLVKEGDEVKAGQLLVRQEDSAESKQLEQLKVQAENTVKIKAAEAQLETRKLELKKIEEAANKGAATVTEVENAKLQVVIAEHSLSLEQLAHEQDIRKYAEMAAQVERMRIKSPIAGKVESVHVRQGESIESLKKAIRVVNTDKLWIDVPVEAAAAMKLAVGQTARIAFPGQQDNAQSGQGKIIFIGQVVDAASNTRMVRIEYVNELKRPAGEHVFITFDNQPVAATSPAELK